MVLIRRAFPRPFPRPPFSLAVHLLLLHRFCPPCVQVDGGCGVANIKDIAEAGADMFVAGSAIFNNPRTQDNYKATIDKMRAELASATIA